MRVLVAGGTGFVGHGVVPELAARGHEVVLLARHPERVAKEWPSVRAVALSIDAGVDRLTAAMKGCDAVVNLVGIIRAKWWRRERFETVLTGGLDLVAAAERAGVPRFVYVSANGARMGGTKYQDVKARIEERLGASRLEWTVLRPSIVFGEGSEFLATFDRLTRLRLVPVFGRGNYEIQPVSRRDVGRAVVASVEGKATGRILHLGGPRVYAWREFLSLVARAHRRRILLVPVPKFAIVAAATLLGWLPGFPATREQLRMLFEGNVVPEQEWLERLGVGHAERLEGFLGVPPVEGRPWAPPTRAA